MHTRFDFILRSDRRQDEMQALCNRLQATVKELERLGNKFDEESELSLLNSGAKEERSDALARILAEAMNFKELTCRLFDPLYSGTWDLSGFLKGYALDRLREILEEEGIENALLNAGNSSILALGSNEGRPWEVEVKGFESLDNPRQPSISLDNPRPLSIPLTGNRALTISGNDSTHRRHIVDPRTGELVEGHRAVAVVTTSAAAGEALATALFIEPDAEKYIKSGTLHEFYSLEKPVSQ